MDIVKGTRVTQVDAARAPITQVRYSPCGKFLGCTCEDGVFRVLGRGLHSSTLQLNMSRFRHKIHPKCPMMLLNTLGHLLNTPKTTHYCTPYPTQSAYVEPKCRRM
jgi:hypothetical protein